MELEEPELQYPMLLWIIPQTPTIKMYFDNLTKNDINTIHGEIEINYITKGIGFFTFMDLIYLLSIQYCILINAG